MAERHSGFDVAAPDAATLAAQHLATLDLVTITTDHPFTLNLASRLRRNVRAYAETFDRGMLGPNGIAPAIADVAAKARFHGIKGYAK